VTWPAPATNVMQATPGRTFVLQGGTLIDGVDEHIREHAVLVIEKGLVTRIGHVGEVSIPTRAEVVDTEGKWIMPGLIDCHAHLTGQTLVDPEFDAGHSSVDIRLLDLCNQAGATLSAGCTLVRDVGSDNGAILRAARREGLLAAPIILTSTRALVSSASRPRRARFGDKRPSHGLITTVLADGVRGCRLAARQAFREGAEFLSIVLSGSCPIAGIDEENGPPNFSAEELGAIVEEARHRSARVAAAAIGTAGVSAAIQAGVDTIENGACEPDQAMLDTMVSKAISLVPNLAAFSWNAEHAESSDGRAASDLSKRLLDRQLRFVDAAKGAGVRIAAGTDRTGRYGPVGVMAELLALTTAGLSTQEAIASGSRNAAAACGRIDTGTVEVGKSAEIIITNSDPLRNLRVLAEPGAIFRVIVSQPSPPSQRAMS
jgi:imidazolonepropionase-like amidohydrolase